MCTSYGWLKYGFLSEYGYARHGYCMYVTSAMLFLQLNMNSSTKIWKTFIKVVIKYCVWFVSDDEVPETVMKDNIVVSKEMLMEGRISKLGSSI